MTDKQAEHIIDSINDGTYSDRAFFHHLILNVHFGRVWPEFPDECLIDTEGYDGYFLMDESGNYVVGLVLDLKTDLRVFVKEQYRRQQLMSSALRDVVLPHIFSTGKTNQNVTYRDAVAKSLVEKVGFTIIDDERAFITAEKVARVNFPQHHLKGLDRGRIDAIRDRLLKAAALIGMARDELAEGIGGSLSDELTTISERVVVETKGVRTHWNNFDYSRSH